MPSTIKSTKWFIRVDYPRDEVSAKLKELSAWVDLKSALAVFHQGSTKENPHFHAIIELTSELQKQSFDRRLHNQWKVKGTQFSSKVWDGVTDKAGAASYLFHEESDDIVLNKGYTQEQIEEFKQLHQQVKKVIETNKESGTNKSIQRIIDKLDSTATRKTIFYTIMDEIRKGGMYHPGFRMSQVVDEIYIKLQSEDNWETTKSEAWEIIREKNKWY